MLRSRNFSLRLHSNAAASDIRRLFNGWVSDSAMIRSPHLTSYSNQESVPLPASASGISTVRGFWKNAFRLFRNKWKIGLSVLTVMRKICPAQISAWLLLAAIALPLATQSAEVLDSSVKQQHGRYMMHTESVVQAPVSKVRTLLMDYENFLRLNPDIKRVEPMEHLDDGGTRMGVSSDFCISAVCLHFEWVQDVRLLPSGDIAVTIVPNRGDFRQGKSRWRLLPGGGGTRLIFDADLTPNHWFPPVFGPWMMKQKLYEEASEIAHGLERMAISNCC